MSIITSNIAIPDQIASLPERCRRGGGRNHEPYWAGTGASSGVVEGGFEGLSFSARSIRPEKIVTFGRKRLTFSFLSLKTGTGQEGEGPWEYALAKELEVDPTKSDYQFHNLRAVWSARGDAVRSYGPDAIWADVEGLVTCAEVKASAGYFAEPDTRLLCNAAEEGLAKLDVRFARVTGDELQQDRRRAFNVSRAFADRLTAVSKRQIGDTLDRLAGGEVALGRLGEILGCSAASRLQTVNALLVGRHLAYDLSAPVTPDLPIQAAALARAGRDIRRIGV